MKSLFFVTLLFSLSAFAKSPAELSKELSKDIQKDIRKDEDKFRKTVSRIPASTDPIEEPRIDETPKMDKNIRQIGPNKW